MLLHLLLAVPATYLLGGLLGYAVHWVFHQPWSGPLYRLHRTHHEVKYPANDFLSREYRDAGAHNTTPWFAAILIVIMAPLFWGIWAAGASVAVMLTVAATAAVVGFLNNWLHDSLHIEGHWLEGFRPFRTWRTAHRVHHANVRYNLGIFSFEWDRILGTWKKPHVG